MSHPRTFVIGVGMTKFDKPGNKDGDYPDWAREAGKKALSDAGIGYEQVERAFAGYCYGDSTYGQRALYGLGLTGIPVMNVNNNCSTGSSAFVRSVYLTPSDPFSIFSKPIASAHSARPPRTASRASHSALDPVEQLLLTFITGMPVSPRP